MADQHLEGAVNTAKGTVNEGVGKATGDKKREAIGTVGALTRSHEETR